jgi:hypothetical protein
MSKRLSAFWAVVQHSVGGGATATIPTPGVEIGKSAALGANEIVMCCRIASIYHKSEVGKDKVIEWLKEAGIAVGGGATLAVSATVVGRGLVYEILNVIPIAGWLLKGGIATSLTATVGCAFIAFCEERWGKD